MANLNIDLNQYIAQLQSLDTKNVGGWPTWVYGFFCVLIVLAIIGGGYNVLIKPEREMLETVRNEEITLRQTFEMKQKKVANLDAYRKQLADMEREFGGMLKQLPSKAEIANLLNDISQTRVSSGLDEELFQPQNEIPKEFYAEVPISLSLVGTYHQLADFASQVSALPRIVTLHDITISVKDAKANAGAAKPGAQPAEPDLGMALTAKTYRYLDDGEPTGAAK